MLGATGSFSSSTFTTSARSSPTPGASAEYDTSSTRGGRLPPLELTPPRQASLLKPNLHGVPEEVQEPKLVVPGGLKTKVLRTSPRGTGAGPNPSGNRP